MPPHRYINKDVLFDDDEEFRKKRTKYDMDGRLTMLEKDRELEDKKKEVLNSTLQSTRNALIMLKESEDAGISSSIELQRQHEALKSTNSKLDQINADLNLSHRRISAMESCFIKIKKCFSCKHRKTKKDKKKQASQVMSTYSSFEEPNFGLKSGKSFENHPSARLNGLNGTESTDTNKLIEVNLEEMANYVSRLKDIGLTMGREIEQQITLLDVIESKVDKANIKMTSQTKRVINLI